MAAPKRYHSAVPQRAEEFRTYGNTLFGCT